MVRGKEKNSHLTANWEIQSILLTFFFLYFVINIEIAPISSLMGRNQVVKPFLPFSMPAGLLLRIFSTFRIFSKYCHYFEKKKIINKNELGNIKESFLRCQGKRGRMVMKWGEPCLGFIRIWTWILVLSFVVLEESRTLNTCLPI